MADDFKLSYTVPVFLGCKKFRKPTLPNLAPIIISLGSYSGTSESNTTVYVQHISGTYLPNTSVTITGSSYIYGTESGVNTVFTSAVSVANTLLPEEEAYWKSVSYYDYENEKNIFNKTILVLDNKFSKTTVKNLTDLMKV